MSKRLFETAQEVQDKNNLKNMLNIYSKIEKESDIIIKRVSKNGPGSYQSFQKQIKNQQSFKPSKKVVQDIIRPISRSKVVNKQLIDNKPIKNRISQLKIQIANEQKSLTQMKKELPSKQQTQYLIFRLKLLCKRINNTQVSIAKAYLKDSFKQLKNDWEKMKQIEAKIIMKRYKKIMKKYFDEFYKQTIITKIQRQKYEHKMYLQKQQKNEKIAQDYRQFILCKKSIQLWKQYYSKQTAQKQKVFQKLQQQNQLRGKLENFLSKMKQEIKTQIVDEYVQQQVIGYNTIQQQLQQSLESHFEDWKNEQNNLKNQNISVQNSQNIRKQKVQKKMTNDELQKKRQQLELKNKQRKQTLAKLKKQKQELKLKIQQQKNLKQQKEKQEQKRKQIQQHERFVRKRKQEQQRRKREDQQRKRMENLEIIAENHSKMRILKYKGLNPWKRIIQIRNQTFIQFTNSIKRINLLVYWRWFLQGYEFLNQKLKQQQVIKLSKAQQFYRKNSKNKIMNVIKYYNKTVATQQKMFLKQFRQQHCVKQVFNIWRKTLPQLKQQNYQLETKQNKLIDNFRNNLLIKVGFDSFRQNKQQQQRQRRILQHKIKLKQKMQQLNQNKPKLNIDDFL